MTNLEASLASAHLLGQKCRQRRWPASPPMPTTLPNPAARHTFAALRRCLDVARTPPRRFHIFILFCRLNTAVPPKIESRESSSLSHSYYPGDTDIQGAHTGPATRPAPARVLLFLCPLVVLLSGLFLGRRERLERAFWYCAAAAATPGEKAPVGGGLLDFGTSCWVALTKRVQPSEAARTTPESSAGLAKPTAARAER